MGNLRIEGIIRQLSTQGGSYINITDGLDGGGIAIWGNHYRQPTYLILTGNNWCLVTFDNEAWRDQELPKLIGAWKAERVLEFPDLADYHQ